MSKVIDLTGQKFNRLLVIEPARTKSGKFAWKCKCDCGKFVIVKGFELKNGGTKSCGCYKNDIARKRLTKHGLSRTKLRSILTSIHSRCENPNHISYKNYGGRGISVCKEWIEDFSAFYEWAINNGYKENLQIDRINNDGNYEPNNCRFVTQKENLMNKRNTLVYAYDGKEKTLQEWAIESGIEYRRLRSRIKECGWSFEKAISTPVRVKNNIRKKEVI